MNSLSIQDIICRYMAKKSSVYICQQCGFHSSQYYGKCPECGTWNSLVETLEEPERVKGEGGRKIQNAITKIIDLQHIEQADHQRLGTNIPEFDRVLGGGIVLGSIVLISGDPGIGKSTLLTQLAINQGEGATLKGKEKAKELDPSRFTLHASPCLYVAGEESARQIKLRAERIKPKANFPVLEETDVDVIIATIKELKPKLAIIDSIQTLETTDLNAAAGSISQVRESAHRLQHLAKSTHIPIFLVGHITKEGTIAGPKALEHLVDVVLTLEGDPLSNFRILRTTKNRFGATDEVGIFEMEESGLIEVQNPSALFLEHKVNAPGSVVVAVMNGQRPLLVEIQALVTKSYLPVPRRVGTGVDINRLQLLVAVLSKRLSLPLYDQDIFVNVTGGVRLTEPAADLAIAIAIASSLKDQSVNSKAVFLGEVGLLGEIRPIRQLPKRIAEAKKLGYTQVISPENAKNLDQAMKQVFKAK